MSPLPEPFEVDLDQARKSLERNRNAFERCRQIMREHGVPFFHCSYETLFTRDTLNRSYSFLGAREQDEFTRKYRVQRSAEVYDRILDRKPLEETLGEDRGLLVASPADPSGLPHVLARIRARPRQGGVGLQ